MLIDLFLLLLILCPFEGNMINITDSKFPGRGKILQNNEQLSSNWSFMAVIVYGKRVLCAGTAFNIKWVITLAHCVHGNLREENLERFGSMSVRLGAAPINYKKIKEVQIKSYELDEDDEFYVPVVDFDELLPVYRVVVHPEYIYKENYQINTRLDFVGVNDLALVKFKRGPMFSVPSLVLYPNFSGWCMAAGWALSISKEPLVRKIYEIQFYIGNNQQCQPYLDISANEIPKDMKEGYKKNKICSLHSGDVTGFEDGDEGGPLICDNRLQGIISHYYQKSDGDYFNFFYDLTQFIAWIKEEIFEVEEVEINIKEKGRATSPTTTTTYPTKTTETATTISTQVAELEIRKERATTYTTMTTSPRTTIKTKTTNSTHGTTRIFAMWKTRPHWESEISLIITPTSPTLTSYDTTSRDKSWDLFVDWDINTTATLATPTVIGTTPITKDYRGGPRSDWVSPIARTTNPRKTTTTTPSKTIATRSTTLFTVLKINRMGKGKTATSTTTSTVPTTTIGTTHIISTQSAELKMGKWRLTSRTSTTTSPTTTIKTTTTTTMRTNGPGRSFLLREPIWVPEITLNITPATSTSSTYDTTSNDTSRDLFVDLGIDKTGTPTTPTTIGTTPITKDYRAKTRGKTLWDLFLEIHTTATLTTPTPIETSLNTKTLSTSITTTTPRKTTTSTRPTTTATRWTTLFTRPTITTPKKICTTTRLMIEAPLPWSNITTRLTSAATRWTTIITRPTVTNTSTTTTTTSGTTELSIWTNLPPRRPVTTVPSIWTILFSRRGVVSTCASRTSLHIEVKKTPKTIESTRDIWWAETTTENPWYKSWIARYFLYLVLSMIGLSVVGLLLALLIMSYHEGCRCKRGTLIKFFRKFR